MTESTGLYVLSASKLKTYSMCSKKYWYEYVQKEEKKGSPSMALGTAVHKTIERVYREHIDPVPTFLAALDTEIETRQIEDDISRQRNDGIKMVTNYKYDKRVPEEIELKFLLNFPNQAHPLCQIVGYIDQVYDWGFVDLKTSSRKPLGGVLDNDIQFIIYDWAFTELFGYEARDKLWHHLRTGEDLYADTTGKLDNAVRIIERIMDSEMTGVYDKTIGDNCRLCDYRKPCLGRSD